MPYTPPWMQPPNFLGAMESGADLGERIAARGQQMYQFQQEEADRAAARQQAQAQAMAELHQRNQQQQLEQQRLKSERDFQNRSLNAGMDEKAYRDLLDTTSRGATLDLGQQRLDSLEQNRGFTQDLKTQAQKLAEEKAGQLDDWRKGVLEIKANAPLKPTPLDPVTELKRGIVKQQLDKFMLTPDENKKYPDLEKDPNAQDLIKRYAALLSAPATTPTPAQPPELKPSDPVTQDDPNVMAKDAALRDINANPNLDFPTKLLKTKNVLEMFNSPSSTTNLLQPKTATKELVESLRDKGMDKATAKKWLDDNGYVLP